MNANEYIVVRRKKDYKRKEDILGKAMDYNT